MLLVQPSARGEEDEPAATAAEELMYFGRVRKLLTHETPGEEGDEGELVLADWFTCATSKEMKRAFMGKQLDRDLMCPIVRSKPHSHKDGPCWFANSIVPWACYALEHPTKKDFFVMLARHWHILRYLAPYPRFWLDKE